MAKNLNFTILLTTFVETIPRIIYEFWGANLVCSLSADVV